jgi:hypothetical protein
LWNGFYTGLLGNLRKRRAWFATAGDATAWFRKRRETVFESVSAEAGVAQLRVPPNPKDRALPGLKLRVCKPSSYSTNGAASDQGEKQILDFPLENSGFVNMTI